ncbi:MAG: MmgE/PrpD family protein [Burkholderiales bacterium]|nr:MmgE/PrpD family protein [Burkholderiales bacterium]
MDATQNRIEATPARRLSEFVHGLAFSVIPDDARRAAVRCLIDSVGIGLACQSMPFARMVTEMVSDWRGVEESTVFGSAIRLPAPSAIIANGNMVHGIDFDNTHGEAMSHPGACIVPTALAVAEKVDANGQRLVEAIVAGLEVQTRIAAAASTHFHARGFHPTFISGCFGTAVTAGKLLGLTPPEMTHALGICGTQASGTFEWLEDGSWAKRFGPGWAGHAGTIAALMAQRGYTGPATIFEGRFGLYRSHVGEGNYDIARLVRGLGLEWETTKLITKRYPCCHVTHPFINAAATLRKQHGFRVDDIADIECLVQRQQAPIVCEPSSAKRQPTGTYEAQFSLYYTVAVTLLQSSLGIDDFAPERLGDATVQSLAARIRYTPYEETPYNPHHPGTLRIRLRDGRQLEQRYDDDIDNAMDDADVAEKFRKNAIRSLSGEQSEALLAAMTEASSAPAIRALMTLTVPRS